MSSHRLQGSPKLPPCLMCMQAMSLQSCPSPCNPMDCSPPGSCVHEVLQTRILEWLPCPPPGDLPDPGIKHVSLAFPALAGEFFTTRAPGKPHPITQKSAKLLGNILMEKHPPSTEEEAFLAPVPRAQNPMPQKTKLPMLNTLLEPLVRKWPGRHDGWQGSTWQ